MTLLPFSIVAQHTLTVNVKGVKSSEGLVGVGVYNTEDAFLKDEVTGVFSAAIEGATTITISDLPEGTYAVSVFHDKNSNKELDTNFIGIPKEPVAFSKAKMKTFGPPSFEECAFTMTSDFEITIPFK